MMNILKEYRNIQGKNNIKNFISSLNTEDRDLLLVYCNPKERKIIKGITYCNKVYTGCMICKNSVINIVTFNNQTTPNRKCSIGGEVDVNRMYCPINKFIKQW